jgi:hypothetical protein
MAMRRSATGLLVLAVMTAGCGDRSADGERAATVSVVNEPAVRIGVADGDERYQFHQVRGVRRLSDGRIVVANGGSGEVRIYDADGEFDLSTGGAGDGPGEFRSLASIDVLPGDSLLALDGGNRRVSVLDPAGAYVRSWTFESPGRGLYPSAAHALPDGSVVIAYFRGRMPGDPPGVFRAAAPVVRYSADGAELGPIGELAGDEWYYSEEHHTLSDRAFGRKGHLAVHDTLIFLGDAAEPAVRVVSTSGAVRTIATDSARPVTAADIAAWREFRLSTVTEPDRRARTERLLDEMPYPAAAPAYAAMLVDTDGDVWLREFEFPEGTHARWQVRSPDGRVRAIVSLPARFIPTFATPEIIGGIEVDDVGVEYVVVYDLPSL